MAPLVKLLGAGSLLAGLVAALTSRFSRRKRKAEVEAENPTGKVAACPAAEPASTSASSSSSIFQRPEPAPSGSSWLPPALHHQLHLHPQPHQRHYVPTYPFRGRSNSGEREGRSSEGQASSGLLSRLLLAAGRPSESLESGVSFSVETAGSSTHGCDEYDSSEEQDVECTAESRSGYGKSDRARLVDLWIESALLVSRDLRLDKRHFDRTTRQNLKKMRPASAQLILSEIADRSWDTTPDISKEIHRLVSHAKAQDKFASAAAAPSAVGAGPAGPGLGFGSGSGLAGPGSSSALTPVAATGGVAGVAVTSFIGPGRGGGAGIGVGVGMGMGTSAAAAAVARSPAAAGGPAGGVAGVSGTAARYYHAVL